MRIVGYTLWLPKEGNSIDEYEDAAFPMDTVDLETRSFKCAVADGATETSFSGLWAQLLVSGYVDGTPTEALQERWRSSLDGKILPWYAEEKAQSGAFAALVGLTIEDGDGSAGRTWEAEAIGDSCLVQVRDKKILAAFPLSKSEQFNSSPLLISSNPAANKAVAAGVERLQGH